MGPRRGVAGTAAPRRGGRQGGNVRKLFASLVTTALAAAGLATIAAPPAMAATVPVPLTCEATAPVVGAQAVNQDLSVSTTAPPSATPGSRFTISASTDPMSLPATQDSDVGTVTLNKFSDFVLRLPVPANSTFVSAALSGGSNVGPGTPTAVQSGGTLVVTVPGPVNGGTTFQFPTVEVTLDAGSTLGSTIEPRLGGTSHADPGLTFSINATIPFLGNADMPVTCFPTPPVPALSVTTIAADTAAPSITLAGPADGANFGLGAPVDADYSCADEQYGSGLQICAGDVADGSPIDTSTLGAHSFTVTARDNAGNENTVTHNYNVIASGGDTTAPTITLTTPASGAVYHVGDAVTAAYSCTDAGSGAATCAGTVANGADISTGSAGVQTFTVDATDNAGNAATASASYLVLAKSPTTMGPTKTGGLVGNDSINVDGADVHVKVYAPVPNGGTLAVGDTFDVEWTVYKGSIGAALWNGGPDPLDWTLPAPTNAVIDGAVTTSETDFFGRTRGDAHKGSGSTGLRSITPSANPSNASQITVSWDDQSSPGAFTAGDGVIMRARFTAKVTSPGTVTVQGFPGMTGWDSSIPAGAMSTDPIPAPGISFNAVVGGAPSIGIASPHDGGLYTPGQSVNASFSCTGATTCSGTAANGSPIDTTSSGPHTFTVNAVGPNGIPASKTVSYYVTDPAASVTGCSVNEGSTCKFDVSLSNASTKTVTVDYATSDGTALAGTNYTASSGTVTFAPGETTKQVSVLTINDSVYDPAHPTFTFDLSNPSGAFLDVGTATGTVKNTTPKPLVIAGNARIAEGDSGTTILTVPVTLANMYAMPQVSAVPVTVDWRNGNYTASSATDYVADSGSLTFDPGETVKSIDIVVNGDTLSEIDEVGLIGLSNPVNANLAGIGPGLGLFGIDDDDPRPGVTVPDSTARALASQARIMKFVVTLDAPFDNYGFVDVATVDGTAVAGTDYLPVSKTLMFPPMVTSQEVWVWVLPGSAGKSFTLEASNPRGITITDGSGTGTIT